MDNIEVEKAKAPDNESVNVSKNDAEKPDCGQATDSDKPEKAANQSTEDLVYKFDEKTKNWQLHSKTGEICYEWCEETQAWNPVTESEYYRWDAKSQTWLPKNDVAVSATTDVDEDGNKIFRDKDGTIFFWDEDKKAWFPKLDVDMLLNYQMNYVFDDTSKENADESKQSDKTVTIPTNSKPEDVSPTELNDKKKPAAPSWFQVDPNHNTKVYVSNLPLDITLDEFAELMGKCGLVNRDPDTNQLKIKLYTEPDGQLKGDGICDYIKMESVHLALEILDEYVYRDHKLSVVQAEFKMRGDYNPELKPKRRKKNKEKLKKMKEKLFDWRPERMRGERAKHERVVIIKNYFTPKIFDEDVKLILEYQNILREECQKCGTVNKVVLYDRHEEGVAQVNMSTPEEADLVIQMMDKRLFGNRSILAEHWDGKTKFKSFESKNEEQQRLSGWEQYLENNEEKDKPETDTE